MSALAHRQMLARSHSGRRGRSDSRPYPYSYPGGPRPCCATLGPVSDPNQPRYRSELKFFLIGLVLILGLLTVYIVALGVHAVLTQE